MGVKESLEEYRRRKKDGTFQKRESHVKDDELLGNFTDTKNCLSKRNHNHNNNSHQEGQQKEEEGEEKKKDKGPKYVYIKEMTWVDILLRVGLYLVCQYVFAYVGFGVPFFLVSVLVAMYLSTNVRWKRRKKGDLSAYSVFNPNFEKLPGEMDGEKMARQYTGGGLVLTG
eukprot:m.46962 g.46962  ORF g.46962 m.46962 type:complete len:170 (-) comp10738_c0_seq1:189-698(-)